MHMTRRSSQRTSIWFSLLVTALFLACSGDDDKGDENVMGPDDGEVVALDTAVLAELNAAVEQAIGLLFLGGGTVPGAGGGQIVVEGGSFRFEQYSPDGEFFLDGTLVMNLLATPVTVKGDMTFRDGETEGPVMVDMTIDASTDPITYGGTIVLDGEVIDLATLE